MVETLKPKAIVAGAGVIGLTQAIIAQEYGYRTTIHSDLPTSRTVSMKAGATFAPYCVPLTQQVTKLTADSWGRFADFAKDSENTGVRKTNYWEIDSNPVDPKDKPYLQVMEDAKVHERPNVPGGYAQGIRFGTFLVDMPIYLQYLTAKFQANGGDFVWQRFNNIYELASLEADIVFNCTGLGAKKLACDDDMTAIRGQLAIIGSRPDLVEPIKHDGFYAFPQPLSNRTVLGGTTVESFEEVIEPGTTQTIVNANKRILPGLRETDVTYSQVGLRPYRRGDVRIEADDVDGALIIHNYGHGGAGVTLSWGSGMSAFAKR